MGRPVTFNEFVVAAIKAHRNYPGNRLGQTLFNTLANVDSDLAEKLRVEGLDPYYDDRNVQDFLTRVQEVLR